MKIYRVEILFCCPITKKNRIFHREESKKSVNKRRKFIINPERVHNRNVAFYKNDIGLSRRDKAGVARVNAL